MEIGLHEVAIQQPTYSPHQKLVSFLKPGRLGIEFRAMSAPYCVLRVVDESHGIQPDYTMVAVRNGNDNSIWVSTHDLSWDDMVAVLKQRPSYAIFVPPSPAPVVVAQVAPAIPLSLPIPNVPGLPRGSSPPGERSLSPVARLLSTEPELPPAALTLPSVVGKSKGPPPLPPIDSPVGSRNFSVTFVTMGPLGMEFADVTAPFRVARVGRSAAEFGVEPGDVLRRVNGKSTDAISWEALREELTVRPVHADFTRPPPTVSLLRQAGTVTSSAVWSLAAELVRGGSTTPDEEGQLSPSELLRQLESVTAERDELKDCLDSVGGVAGIMDLCARVEASDRLGGQVGQLSSEVEEARAREETALRAAQGAEARRVEAVTALADLEVSQADILTGLESQILQLNRECSLLRSQSTAAADAQRERDTMHLKLTEVEAELDSARLAVQALSRAKEEQARTVDQCMQKIQSELAERPNLIDRRTVCSAVVKFIWDYEGDARTPEDQQRRAAAQFDAKRRLADILGLSSEEQTALLSLVERPSSLSAFRRHDEHKSANRFGDSFVAFLESEAMEPRPSEDD